MQAAGSQLAPCWTARIRTLEGTEHHASMSVSWGWEAISARLGMCYDPPQCDALLATSVEPQRVM